jgi:N-methylhydantoinase A
VFSAHGILTADARHDYEQMLVGTGPNLASADVEQVFAALEESGRAQIAAGLATYRVVEAIRAAELRYTGQDHPISVDLPPREEAGDVLEVAHARFHEKHERLYGFRRDDTPVEIVRVQLSVVGRLGQAPATYRGGTGSTSPSATRRLYTAGQYRDCPVYDRESLTVDATLVGPTVVEEAGSTTYVPVGFQLRVGPDGTMHVRDPSREEGAR